MNASYARTLVDFHYWARDRMLDAVLALPASDYTKELGSSFSSVCATVQHTYGAEVVWLQRWQGASPTAFPGAMPPGVLELRDAWQAHEVQFRAFVASLDDEGIQRVVRYRLFSGAEGESPIWQMLAHVVNHASYHRGQVTTLLRQLGAAAPASTDMIGYFRERAGG